MGCDHLICKKCKVGFDLESGTVFWVSAFLQDHWHKKQKLRGSYFEMQFSDFPKHLRIAHHIPAGYISVGKPSVFCKRKKVIGGLCFHRECLLYYIGWIKKKKKSGKWRRGGYEGDPFVVRKNNPDHDWLRGY